MLFKLLLLDFGAACLVTIIVYVLLLPFSAVTFMVIVLLPIFKLVPPVTITFALLSSAIPVIFTFCVA